MMGGSMNDESRVDHGDERALAALLRAAGARQAPSPRATTDVRAAVEAEWRATVSGRARRRQWTGWAAAASVAVAAVGAWLLYPSLQTEPVRVADVTRVVGSVEQDHGDGRWSPLTAGDSLGAGTRLRTAGDGRLALELASGVELRLDADTELALARLDEAALARGAVYVDSGAANGSSGADLELATPAGSVRHLGTQYEARVLDGSVRVGVREGRIRVAADAGDVFAGAGERLVIENGALTRERLARTDADWQWIADVTPPFTLEGRTVEEFLVWAARETGRTVVYASPAAAQRARAIQLSGTVEGLTPDEAVAAALSTTSLEPAIGAEHIRVEAVTP